MKEILEINDRHEYLNLYTSQCAKCKHFDWESYTCEAFPVEIPDELLSGEEGHNKILPNQTGESIFEEDAISS